MDSQQLRARRQARRRELTRRRRRAAALVGLAAAAVIAAVVAAGSGGNSGNGAATNANASARSGPSAVRAARSRSHTGASGTRHGSTVSSARGTGRPGTEPVPVLMYHVINPPPAGAPFPGLYVPSSEFADQMQALAHAGWHAVTLDQMEAYWTRGVPLPRGRPIVVTFDNGYQSQYTNALPVLRSLHWPGDLNVQLTGLPPSQGGLSRSEVRGLIDAGWELDTQGFSHADLITLDPSQLHYQVAESRQVIQARYHVPVNWFCYPSGHFDSTVVAAVRAAGYVGSTTTIPGWGRPSQDPYRLERIRVLGGTSGSALLSLIDAVRANGPPPSSYGGAGAA